MLVEGVKRGATRHARPRQAAAAFFVGLLAFGAAPEMAWAGHRIDPIAASSIDSPDLSGRAALEVDRAADFEYRCVIVATPTGTEDVAELPPGLPAVAPAVTFHVEYWATDSGTTNTGIVSAYTDLDYPESCVAAEQVNNGDVFGSFPDGADDGSKIDELGGSQLSSGIGLEPQWVRIAYVDFSALGSCGRVEFRLTPAVSESSAFGRGLISSSDIGYGTCDILVGGEDPSVPAAGAWGVILVVILYLTSGTIILRRPDAGANRGASPRPD